MNKKISMEGQYFSQFGEDKWIVDNLRYPLEGIFVDVGASDGIYGNNTYFFEKIGWRGLCIDADPSHHAYLQANRRSKFRYRFQYKNEQFQKEFAK
jgi:hypothetical protein